MPYTEAIDIQDKVSTSTIDFSSYIIYRDGIKTNAVNGTTGIIDFSGTNATIVIQNVINVLTNGGKIFIMAGIYDITYSIIIKNYVEVTGEDFVTILRASGFGTNNNSVINIGILDNGNVGCVLSHLTIDGNKASCTQSDGVRIYSQNSKVHNVYIKDCGYIGMRTVGTNTNRVLVSNCIVRDSVERNINLNGSHIIVSDNLITGSKTGIRIGALYDSIISNNIIRDTSESGIYTDDSNELRLIIANNKVSNTYWDPISIHNASMITIIGNSCSDTTHTGDGIIVNNVKRVTITGNILKDTNGGIVITSSDDIAVTGNIANFADNHGIGVSDSKYLSIIGNHLYYNDQIGISLNNTNYSTISENICIDNGQELNAGNQSGIQLSGSSQHNLIKGNILRDDQGVPTQIYGIREINTADYNTIIDNDISGSTIMIAKVGTNTKIKNNMGYITESNILSDAFAIDSTGVKIVTVTHGLAMAPAVQDCYLTIVQDTAVDDWAYNMLKIVSTNTTNVTAKINVSIASVTKGATARLGLKVGKL